ncbi:MAG: Gfo/Idh/MocA family oxidoreductase [Chloroflexota bacterium]|nr:Gfo/Idh/MocA family oxidoreductase [Chloroflexota bacterium]
MSRPGGVLVVGCGDIAERYATDIARQPNLRLVGAVDLDPARAAAVGERHGARAHATLDDALADDEVDLVANLTGHHAHVPVSRAAIDAGRHVFSEKPFALSAADAGTLVALAEERNVGLAAAPIVLLGELAQTARCWLDAGHLGTVRLAYAEVNWGRIEAWHAYPRAFYDVGPLFDVGVYPLTLLAGLLGPFARVEAAHTSRLLRERRAKTGETFEIAAPDFATAVLTTVGGAVVRLTANFYVADPARQRGVELHGDAGSLWISNWFQFDGMLEYAPHGRAYRRVPLLRQPEVPISWAAGVADLWSAVQEGRRPRADAALASHVIEVMEAIIRAADEGRGVELDSRPQPPPPPEWVAGLPLVVEPLPAD